MRFMVIMAAVGKSIAHTLAGFSGSRAFKLAFDTAHQFQVILVIFLCRLFSSLKIDSIFSSCFIHIRHLAAQNSMAVVVTLDLVAVLFAFAATAGIFFGYYPARKAAY